MNCQNDSKYLSGLHFHLRTGVQRYRFVVQQWTLGNFHLLMPAASEVEFVIITRLSLKDLSVILANSSAGKCKRYRRKIID